MKRVVLFLVIAFALTMAVSAQTYIVQEINGRVEQNKGGRWEPVSLGDTLRADAVIRTLIGARLSVRAGNEILIVGAMRNGKLADLLDSNTVIEIQDRVSHTDTESTERVAGRITTASARASDAAGDFELEE